ncbi:Aspartate/glutamate/uridylate kinase [Hyaloraphidium curvatum]|nr:Aspartate/glutamate/uridylate kinase [Hyaloraphidium curvatum]
MADAGEQRRAALARYSKKSLTIVLKLGTSSICDEKTHLPLLSNLSALVETVVRLRGLGHRVVIVSSGAIGTGLRRLNLDKKPKHLAKIQAVAAVGQGRLMSLYDDLFGQFNQPIAQILLSRNNLSERTHYLNACNTFLELLNMGVVPIVNENDAVSVSEIREGGNGKFGDNDTLSAITAGMINADFLFLMTDVDALYSDNPRTNPDAKPLRVVDDITETRVKVTTPGSSLGTGGMVTKLIAAELATAAGCATVVCRGSEPSKTLTIIQDIAAGKEPSAGTVFLPKPNPMIDRKWWIMHGLATAGTIFVDHGAVRAIVAHRSSLFAAGITNVEGNFGASQAVKVVTVVREPGAEPDKEVETVVEIAKGLVNYPSADVQRIKGCKSSEIVDRLGVMESDSVIHRDNLVIRNGPTRWLER